MRVGDLIEGANAHLAVDDLSTAIGSGGITVVRVSHWEQTGAHVWSRLDDEGVARHWVFQVTSLGSPGPEPQFHVDQGFSEGRTFPTLAEAKAAAEAMP